MTKLFQDAQIFDDYGRFSYDSRQLSKGRKKNHILFDMRKPYAVKKIKYTFTKVEALEFKPDSQEII
jgi:hypothetical protein